MVIQRLGGYFTKLSVGDQIIGINPPGKDSRLPQAKFGAGVALQSLHHVDFNGLDQLEGKKNNQCYAIKGPGEYEIADIFVHGFAQETSYVEGETHLNTIYSLIFDGIKIVYLGPLSGEELGEQVQEDLYQADIIFIPIGGGQVLGADQAFALVKKFSPRIVIPLAYEEGKGKGGELEAFVSHFGEEVKGEDKLTLKKKDLEEERMRVVVLQAVS